MKGRFELVILSCCLLHHRMNGIKILVLHGKGSSGLIFRNRIQKFIDVTNANAGIESWSFPDAPHALFDSKDSNDGYAWWRLPDGVRSFDAIEYGEIQKSFDFIENNYSDVDIIIGHSQGAMLASILLARRILSVSPLLLKDKKLFQPKLAILSGAAWPKPYGDMLESLSDSKIKASGLKSLHIIGSKDTTNPPEMAYRVAQCLHGEVYEHDGGHIFPVDDIAIKKYISLLTRLCENST